MNFKNESKNHFHHHHVIIDHDFINLFIKFACKLYKQVYEIMIDDDVMVMKVILTFSFNIHDHEVIMMIESQKHFSIIKFACKLYN